MPISHGHLLVLYRNLRAKYFSDSIPEDCQVTVGWDANTPKDCDSHVTMTFSDGESKLIAAVIQLDPYLRPLRKYMRVALLHEMIHMKQKKIIHGKGFDAEWERLMKLGALKGLL